MCKWGAVGGFIDLRKYDMLIFICDDEEQDLAAMQACLEKAAADLPADIEISAYSSGKALMKAVEDGAKPELAILDIYIEGINGIEAGRGLRSAASRHAPSSYYAGSIFRPERAGGEKG